MSNRRIMRFISALWEYRLGVKTRGNQTYKPGPDSIWYQCMSYSEIFTILRRVRLEPSDTFIDIGCGKGRVICCAAQFKVSEVIGVEIDKSLSDIAQRNALRIRRHKSPIRIINSASVDYGYRDGSVYYLYHPFGASTLRKTLQQIKKTLELYPRKIRIVYVYPVHESVLEHTDWLERYDSWEKKTKLFHKVSFWRSK